MKSLARLAKTPLRRFFREEHGQDLVEYALLTGLISLAAIAAIGSMSDEVVTIFRDTGLRMGARSVSEPAS